MAMPGTFKDAYRRLAAAQKGHARGAPAYSVYVNRRIGRVLAAWGHSIGMTPNTATVVSALHTFTALALIVLAPATVWAGVLIALLLVLGYAWDSSDGQLARLRGGGSLAGEWLDHFIDALKISSLHLCVLVGLWLHTPFRDTGWLVVPLVFSAVGVTTFFGMLLNDLLKGKRGVPSTHGRGEEPRSGRSSSFRPTSASSASCSSCGGRPPYSWWHTDCLWRPIRPSWRWPQCVGSARCAHWTPRRDVGGDRRRELRFGVASRLERGEDLTARRGAHDRGRLLQHS
ncbi:CDP-alcohol phosphatidyltransferase family protein [Microbacterium sp. 1P10UB]|uniref:CDP-alcohol phosphatidyltransferase family protein n=1 Tax=unclassified Microbacterium TaxID=2609290 RepID=UPI00399F2525